MTTESTPWAVCSTDVLGVSCRSALRLKRGPRKDGAAKRTDKASKLYTERQFAVICGQLVIHVGAMAELYAGEPA